MTAGALVVGYGLSKFAGNTPKKYEIVRSMNRRSLKEVCKRAYIDEYIESLPKKYNTIIGEGGINLSGEVI